MRPTHRLTRLAALGTASVLLLSSCSDATSSPTEPTGAEADRPLRIAQTANTLDPHNTASVGSDLSIIGSVYSSLVRRDAEGEIGPDIAQSWEQVDANTWRFELNPDATFSDGTPLTAETVVWNFERVLDEDAALRLQSFFSNVSEVTATDEHTVDISTEQPDADLLMSLSFFYLLDPEWASQNDPAADAMGSGPYELTSYTPQGPLSLQARDDYWAEPASISTIEYLDLGSADAEVNALQAGEVDLVSGLAPADLDRLGNVEGIQLAPIESSRAAYVKFNTLLEPVDDVTVRQALNHAVDKQAIIDSILRGTVDQSQGQILTENFTGFDEDLEPYAYDPDLARELLAEAGYGDGFELELEYPTNTYVEADAIVQAVAANLEDVGVTVTTSSAPFDTWLSKYVDEGDMAQSIYITQSWQTTSGFLGLFEQGSPYAYFEDDEYVDLLNQARYASTPEEQAELYSQTLRRFREQAPVLFLFPQPAIYGLASGIAWTPSADGWILPYHISYTD